ncbi:MerR family transcriptional regulator [Streptomyces sp. JJ36]|uniref:MerR family transcriptional regulator n=1 Tax=Streptomyces sp. JJ36 TaxID=2736645 RepID=UPI001F013419|nr:MerR family transcriptional regulator [Streptomyces sp. JJ36]
MAKAAGITERTLRFYRERKLLPPPRREGRIAWYDEHHLARLRTITTLLQRGHTLGGIAELLTAFEKGATRNSAAELLGVDSLLTGSFSDETPVRLTPEDMADYFGSDITAEDLAASLDLGYVAVEGDEMVHVSRRLLDASAALVEEGIPLSAVLEGGRRLRTHVDVIARIFSELLRSHVLPGDLSPADAERINTALERLRPLAQQVVDAELGLALDRRVREEVAEWFRQDGGAPGS